MKKFNLARVVEQFGGDMLREDIGQSNVPMESLKLTMPMVNRHRIEENMEQKLELLPRSLQYLYLQTKQITVQWRLQKNSNLFNSLKHCELIQSLHRGQDPERFKQMLYVSGLVNINSIDAMFDRKNVDAKYAPDYPSNFQIKDNFYPFDSCWDLVAFLQKNGDKLLDNIFLLDRSEQKIYDMQISVEKYLELAFIAKGFYHWQLTYVQKNHAPHYKVMEMYLPQILSHTAYDLKEFGIV